MIQPRIDDPGLPCEIERLGFDSLWVPDSHMISSDCYAVLTLAAVNTSRIRLGTGVSIASTRIAPVTAHSIATINRLAPGRVFLGLGTGHTAMRTMGFDPVPPSEFREYLRVVRGLLRDGEVEFKWRGRSQHIQFLHRQLGLIDIDHPIPIYVAANGPRALRAAGEFGDGRVSADNEPKEGLEQSLAAVRAGAAAAGRALPADFHTATLAFTCVLRPGETLESGA
jgi:alkanesulfonate monooxygenase SsuD/methylene tetrahydromethanopterin reductase-like flavin-dependent oxidoreductase (luciferase family)